MASVTERTSRRRSRATTAFGRQTDFDPGRLPIHKSTMAVFGFENGAMAQVLVTYELPQPGLGSMMQYAF